MKIFSSLHFEKEVAKRQKQTGVVEKAGILQNKMSQGGRGKAWCMFFVQCGALLDPWNFP